MQIRKLTPEEHDRTREVWEQIFTEDGPDFLDYYYDRKSSDNQMYVVEKGEELVSMLHLNPYMLQIGAKRARGNYIVAVATKENYRHQGMMAALLKESMREMREEKQPFTFLMPAAEAIYRPFDFRFIYDQHQESVNGSRVGMQEMDVCVREADRSDCEALAEFATYILAKKYQVYAVRTREYYEMILQERKSEAGGIRIVERNGRMLGFVPYVLGEEGCEVLEPLYEASEEQSVLLAISELGVSVSCRAMQESAGQKKPMIMARILHLPIFISCLSASEEVHLIVRITDPILEENNGTFLVEGKEQLEIQKSGERAEAEFTIAGLTSYLFGYCELDELVRNEEAHISKSGRKELEKIKVLSHVFLNEVV